MDEVKTKKPSRKIKRKIFTGLALIALFVGMMVFLFSGDNVEILKDLFKADITKEEVRKSLSSLGWRGYIGIGILSMLQVVLTFLPAEPVQVMAGISFGLLTGGLVCLAGVVVGNTIMYIMYKIYGQKLTNYVSTNAEFDFDYARRSKRVAFIILILYFLPAIPYGLICLFTASLNTRYPKYIMLTTLGAIPSIMIGVGLGHLAIASSWIISIIVFAVLIAALIVLWKNKKKVFAKINEYMKNRAKKASKPHVNKVFWNLCLAGTRLMFDRKVKVRLQNNVGRLEKPAIVLCNHGSFLDFVYAGRMLTKEKPHFVAARLYFYHKWLNKIIRSLGGIPKSMFATDLENVKGTLSVLSDGGLIAMMPEARLSTAGKFEGIQDVTYRFIQKMNVPVYVCKLNGDYFADPKWGTGMRRGSVVEGELNKLISKEEIADMPFEQLKERIETALAYDEFAWLESKPDVHYRSKTLAEGLENILYRCPKCGGTCTLTSKGHTVTCEKCGMQATLNDRYGFVDNEPFENFGVWYEWQAQEIKKEIESNPDYKLESKVELRHGSIDGKSLTRHAGEGVCTLDKTGLTYKGTRDGEEIEKVFPLSQIYRLLFGAGVNFEIYEGKEIWFFVPEEKRSCVIWYVVSTILKETYGE